MAYWHVRKRDCDGHLPTPVQDALQYGRGGLGTAIVFVGGNTNANANTNTFTANCGTIVASVINTQAEHATV